MNSEKASLSLVDVESQSVLELPDRELLALPINIQRGLVNVAVGVEDVNVGVCANVTVIGQDIPNNCDVRQS